MNLREVGRHLGVSHTAIQKAIKSGRLSRAVTRDAKGKVSIDPVMAAAEWQNTGRLPTTGSALKAHTAAGLVGEMAQRLSELIGAQLQVLGRQVTASLPYLVAGAVEAIRGKGREPSRSELEAVLLQRPGAEAERYLWIYALLLAAIDDGLSAADRIEMARGEGRRAVLGEADGVADGDEG